MFCGEEVGFLVLQGPGLRLALWLLLRNSFFRAQRDSATWKKSSFSAEWWLKAKNTGIPKAGALFRVKPSEWGPSRIQLVLQGETSKKPTAVDTAPAFEVRESRFRA